MYAQISQDSRVTQPLGALSGEGDLWRLLAADGMIDGAACEGMIVGEGPDRLRRDAVLVRCGVPLYLLVTAAHVTLTPAQREDIVVEGIAAPWSLRCLCDRQPMYSRFPEVEPSAPTAAGGRGPVRPAHPGGPGVRRRRGPDCSATIRIAVLPHGRM